MILALILLLLGIFVYRQSYLNKSITDEEEIRILIEEYQLPNGMFYDRIDKGTTADAFSTCYIQKINKIIYIIIVLNLL